jgi:hypothetical protein
MSPSPVDTTSNALSVPDRTAKWQHAKKCGISGEISPFRALSDQKNCECKLEKLQAAFSCRELAEGHDVFVRMMETFLTATTAANDHYRCRCAKTVLRI